MRFQSGKSGKIEERPLTQQKSDVSGAKEAVSGRGQSDTRPANAKIGHDYSDVKISPTDPDQQIDTAVLQIFISKSPAFCQPTREFDRKVHQNRIPQLDCRPPLDQ